MAAAKFAKFAVTFGAGVSGGYVAKTYFKPEYDQIQPPTFANLEPKTKDFEWGPVIQWDHNWDQRHFDKNEEKKPKASRHLLLIRHGQYNLKGVTDSQRYLTELGTEQALLTGARLAELNLPWTSLVCSTMTRAQQTAGLIRQALPENVPVKADDPLLAEGAPYPPEPPTSFRPEHKWFSDGSRIEAAFRKYFHRADLEQTEDSYEMIVCHANVIRYFVCRAMQIPPEAWLRLSLKHASITSITIRPSGKVSVRGIGEAGHFPPDKLTTT